VSLQARTDLGSVSNADAVYFGFTRDGLGASLANAIVISANNSGTTDPTDAVIFRLQLRHRRGWTTALGPLPSWIKDVPCGGTMPPAMPPGALIFKVSLGNAGVSVNYPSGCWSRCTSRRERRIQKRESLHPGAGANALLPNTLIIADPANWAIASR